MYRVSVSSPRETKGNTFIGVPDSVDVWGGRVTLKELFTVLAGAIIVGVLYVVVQEVFIKRRVK